MAESFILVSVPLLFTWYMLTTYVFVIDTSRKGTTFMGVEVKKTGEEKK